MTATVINGLMRSVVCMARDATGLFIAAPMGLLVLLLGGATVPLLVVVGIVATWLSSIVMYHGFRLKNQRLWRAGGAVCAVLAATTMATALQLM